jgi:hypothetical protein
MQTQLWTGTHISPCLCAAVVKYLSPTNSKGSRWKASIKRDSETTWTATVPFNDGPVAAFNALRFKHGLHEWTVGTIASLDADTYVITVN